MVTAALAVVLAAGALALPVLTGLGAHRRGQRWPLAVVAGLAFPVTWAVWYVRDEEAYAARH
jgi:hypothetical protein